MDKEDGQDGLFLAFMAMVLLLGIGFAGTVLWMAYLLVEWIITK